MYALCHAEYLVFMNKTKLPLRLQRNLGTLREMKVAVVLMVVTLLLRLGLLVA